MKKVIIGFILVAIIFGSIGIYASSYLASDISYSPTDETWNVSNVNEALNDLYNGNQEFYPFTVEYVYNNYIGSTNTISFTTTVETGDIDVSKYKIVGGITKVEPWQDMQGKYINVTSNIESCENGITTIKITVTADATYGLAGPVNYSGAIYKI